MRYPRTPKPGTSALRSDIGNLTVSHRPSAFRACAKLPPTSARSGRATFDRTREFFAQRAGDLSKARSRTPTARPAQSLDDSASPCFVEHFSAQFAALTPQEFTEKVLVDGLHVKWLMVGDDFCYGARRAGDVAMLQEAGRQYGFHVETLPTVMNGSTRISSSAVRLALAAGDFPLATQLLGHPYAISGHVIHGQKLGRTLGFPTLNLRVAHRPPSGILSGRYTPGTARAAVASLACTPTVDDSGRVLRKCICRFRPSDTATGTRNFGKLRDEKIHDLPH